MRDPYGAPTPRQLGKAVELGIAVPPNVTKLGLRQLIDDAPATEKQRDLARALGIDVTEKMTVGRLMPLVKAELGRQGYLALRNNSALRPNKYIVHENVIYQVTNIGRSPDRPSVSVRPLTGGNAKALSAFTVRNAYEVDKHGNKL